MAKQNNPYGNLQNNTVMLVCIHDLLQNSKILLPYVLLYLGSPCATQGWPMSYLCSTWTGSDVDKGSTHAHVFYPQVADIGARRFLSLPAICEPIKRAVVQCNRAHVHKSTELTADWAHGNMLLFTRHNINYTWCARHSTQWPAS